MSFVSRHVGNLTNGKHIKTMLRKIGVKSFDDMISKTGVIRNYKPFNNNLNHCIYISYIYRLFFF